MADSAAPITSAQQPVSRNSEDSAVKNSSPPSPALKASAEYTSGSANATPKSLFRTSSGKLSPRDSRNSPGGFSNLQMSDNPQLRLLRRFVSVYEPPTMEPPKSEAIAATFGFRGVAFLGLLLFAVLITGTVCVWWFTGYKTRDLVLCLVQVRHMEVAAQVSSKFSQLSSEAASVLALATASSVLLQHPNVSGTLGTSGHDELLLQRIARASTGGTNSSRFDEYMASFVESYPMLSVHLVTTSGAYFGLKSDAESRSVSMARQAVDGCLLEYVRPWSAYAGSSAKSNLFAKSTPTPTCEWQPHSEAWYIEGSSCASSTAGGSCWSAPYTVSNGAAIALLRPLWTARHDGSRGAFGGVVAVEMPLFTLETYMRELLASTTEHADEVDFVLVDSHSRLLASSAPVDTSMYLAGLPAESAWTDVQMAVERSAMGEAQPLCSLAFRSNRASFCDDFTVDRPLCASVGPLPIGGACSLVFDCGVAPQRMNDTRAQGALPDDWKLRMVINQASYYPGFEAATLTTLAFSICSSIAVSSLLLRLIWLYNRENGELDLRICGNRLSAKVAQALLLLLVMLNYFIVYLTWYVVFKSAAHYWRNSIIQVLNEAMVDRLCTALELLPRVSTIMKAWMPLWETGITSNGGWETDPVTSIASFPKFAVQIASALSLGRGQQPLQVLSASPPTTRRIVDAPVAALWHVPSDNRPAEGVRIVAEPTPAYQFFDYCDGCPADPRHAPWWSTTVSRDASFGWSEVHLLGDQLSSTFVLPIQNGSWNGSLSSHIACTMPLASLQHIFAHGSGPVPVAGLVLQRAAYRSGLHQGDLIASSAKDVEARYEVGGEWFTGRRQATDSIDRRIRNAATAVWRTMNAPDYRAPTALLMGLDTGMGQQVWNGTRLLGPDRARVYRIFGGPRTYITPVRGSGCTQSKDDACGLDWTAVMLFDWIRIFSQWYRERDTSLLVFFVFLAIQIYVLQVVVHSVFRHVEHEVAEANNESEESRPNHQDAIAELAEPGSSSRASIDSSRGSTSSTRFERYRVLIAEEVHKALEVPWRRIKVLSWLQYQLYRCIKVLPASVQDLTSIKRFRLHLKRRASMVAKETQEQRRHRQAIAFMRYAKQHRNILTICTLRRGLKFAALQVYMFRTTATYHMFLICVVLFHCGLQAHEPLPAELKLGKETGHCPVYGLAAPFLSLICLIVEAVDVACETWIVRAERQVTRRLRATTLRRHESIYFSKAVFEGENLLQPRSEAVRRILRSIVLIVIAIDWLLLVGMCSTKLITHFVPLRPVFLLLTSSSLSTTLASIFATLSTRGMRSVAVCFVTFWLTAAMFAATMLRSQGNGVDNGDSDPSCSLGSPPPPSANGNLAEAESDSALNAFSFTAVNFQSIIPSLISTFVLISTGENYVEVVSRRLFCFSLAHDNIWSMPPRAAFALMFFVVLSLVGIVMLVGMFIGVFQDGFARQRRDELQKTKLFERVGAIAAFSLLDHDGSAKVPLCEFKEFVLSLERNLEMTSVLPAEGLFHLLHENVEEEATDAEDDALDLSDFVFKLYLITLIGVTLQRKDDHSNASAWRKAMRNAYDHPAHLIQKLIKFLLILHTLLACLYGLLSEQETLTLDHTLALLLMVEAIEVTLKLVVYGPHRFWSCAQYNAARTFEQWENRTSLIISWTVLFAWIVTRGTSTAIGLGFTPNDDFGRLLLVLPSVRLFFVLRTARRIIFVLVPLRTYLISIASLMFVFALIAAIIGVTIFHGVFESVSNALDQGAVRITSFDSVGSALLTLTQVLVGEGWHDIMIATMNGRHSWYWAMYFIIYVVVQYLLLTNLLVGVVLDSTTGFEEDNALQQQVLHGDQLNELDELRQGYAEKRRTGDDHEPAPRPSLATVPFELTLRRTSASAPGVPRTSIVSAQPLVSPLDAPKPRTPFQLFPQLTKRRLIPDEKEKSRRPHRMSTVPSNVSPYSNLDASSMPGFVASSDQPQRSVTSRPQAGRATDRRTTQSQNTESQLGSYELTTSGI